MGYKDKAHQGDVGFYGFKKMSIKEVGPSKVGLFVSKRPDYFKKIIAETQYLNVLVPKPNSTHRAVLSISQEVEIDDKFEGNDEEESGEVEEGFFDVNDIGLYLEGNDVSTNCGDGASDCCDVGKDTKFITDEAIYVIGDLFDANIERSINLVDEVDNKCGLSGDEDFPVIFGNPSICLGKENHFLSTDLGPTREDGLSLEKCLAFRFRECPVLILKVESKLVSSEFPLCFNIEKAMTNFVPGYLNCLADKDIVCYEGDESEMSLGLGGGRGIPR
ncbi:unnamed protein product, partial [Ilex paraguariensis]